MPKRYPDRGRRRPGRRGLRADARAGLLRLDRRDPRTGRRACGRRLVRRVEAVLQELSRSLVEEGDRIGRAALLGRPSPPVFSGQRPFDRSTGCMRSAAPIRPRSGPGERPGRVTGGSNPRAEGGGPIEERTSHCPSDGSGGSDCREREEGGPGHDLRAGPPGLAPGGGVREEPNPPGVMNRPHRPHRP